MKVLLKKNKKVFFFAVSLAFTLFILPAAIPAIFSISPAFAQTQITIATTVPGTYGAAASAASPGAFIANFYTFSLIIGGILAFGVVVYGGVKYMVSAGNPSGQSDAKEWIEAALLGLLLLVGVYFILDVINPQLLNLNLPTLTSVNLSRVSALGGGTGSAAAGKCQAPTNGNCTVANLQQTCLGSNAALFGAICANESGGNPATKSGTDYCNPPNGQTCTNSKGQPTNCSVSVGLFQVNLTNSWKQPVMVNGQSQNCGNAFQGQAISCSGNGPCTTGSHGTGQQCQVTNMSLYNACVTAAQSAANNLSVACQLSNNGQKTTAWTGDGALSCGL